MNSSRLRIVVAVAAFTVVAAGAIASVLTDEPESGFAENGTGTGPLVQDANLQGMETLRLLSGPLALTTDPDHDPARTLLVVMGPSRPYDAAEVQSIHRFLRDGGQLLVADDFGRANSITSGLGITFERVRIVDDADAVQATATIDGRSFDLWVDTPTALRAAPGLTYEVLATTAETSFLDRDGNGLIDAGDPLGPFPLAVVVEIGLRGGRLVAVADTTPFLEAGADQADNRDFRQSLLAALLPQGGRVVVDESREPSSDPWLLATAALVAALSRGPGWYLIGTVVVATAVLGGIIATRSHWGAHVFHVDRFVRRTELTTVGQAPRSQAAAAHTGQSVHWTLRGRSAVFGGLALLVLGIMVGSRQATYAAALLLLAGALAVWARPLHATAQRRASLTRVMEESPFHIDLAVMADGHRGGDVEVLDGLPPEFALAQGSNWFQTTLGSKTPCQTRYEVRPALRGPYEVGPLLVRSSDPFRLRSVETCALESIEILVPPRHEPLNRIPFKSKLSALTLGPHLVNRAGDGSEFHALRDYQSGDSIRSINWKASARSKDFVVNQRVHESMSTITIFIDARALSGAGPLRNNPLNEACRASLSVATGAVQARDRVRVFAYGDGVHELASGGGQQQIHTLYEALARLEPAGSTPLRTALVDVLPSLKARTPFILVSGLEGDPSILDAMRDLRQRGVLPTVLAAPIGTVPESISDGPGEPNAHRLQAEHKQMMSDIRGLGIPVVPLVADKPLSAALQRGIL